MLSIIVRAVERRKKKHDKKKKNLILMSHLALFKFGLFASAEPSLARSSFCLLYYPDGRKEGRKEASMLLMQLQLKLHINIHG